MPKSLSPFLVRDYMMMMMMILLLMPMATVYLAMPRVDVDCLPLVVGRVTSKDLTPGHYLGHCENLIDRIGDNDASVVVGG